MNSASRISTVLLSIGVVAFIASPSPGMICVGVLTKEKAKEKYGITMHAHPNGAVIDSRWLARVSGRWLNKGNDQCDTIVRAREHGARARRYRVARCRRDHRPQAAVTEPKAVVIDPIDRLVAELSATHGMWRNGLFPVLSLPQSATPEEVIRKLFGMGLSRGEIAHYRILETRQIRIPGFGSDSYTAALVEKDSVMKIVLMQFMQIGGGIWWTCVYDTRPST